MDTVNDDPLTDEPLVLGGVTLHSRLLVGTGKYASFEETARALELSGTDCVTVAVRRVNLDAAKGPSLLDHIDRSRIHVLPNTAGCFDAASAIVSTGRGHFSFERNRPAPDRTIDASMTELLLEATRRLDELD